jgi:succinoglycan biosynthesis transport protein ExoP
MELFQYWRIIRKHLWLILLLPLVAGASAVYYGLQQVPLYSSTTTLFLNPAASSPLLPYDTSGSVKSLANTYVEFVRTRKFAGLVGQELRTPLSEGEIMRALSTQLVPDTQFFRISATHPDPQQAQDLANSAATVLIAENTARQQAQREQIEAQRDPAKMAEKEQLTGLQQSLQDELAYVGDRIADLQAQIAELEGKPPSEDNDQQIMSLREELVNQQSLRVQLYGSLAQTQSTLASGDGETAALAVDTAVVVDPAPLPTDPVSRSLPQYVLLALVAGLGLGGGLAFLLEYLDWTIKTPEELDALYGQSTLGVIATIKNGKTGKAQPEQVVALTNPQSPIAEAFRALRTNLQFACARDAGTGASPGRPLRSLLITSAGPMEGKTLTAANLAVVLAHAGSRVILVDADLRRPRLHRVFDVPREPGLTNLIIDGKNGDVESYLRPTAVKYLRVLPCGPLPRNPAELLGLPRTAQVMEQLQGLADMVIYDSPPVATVTDAVVLGSRVDGVLHVVQAGGPRREVVLRVKAQLEKVGARVLGPVLNQVDISDVGYYHYYYYYGYYHNGHDQEKQTLVRRLLKQRQNGNGDEDGV